MIKYDTDIVAMYLQRAVTRENLPEADSREHAKQEKRLFLWVEESQKRQRRGTEQNLLCNHVMFQRPAMKIKGRLTWCHREGNKGHSAAHRAGGTGEEPHWA